MKWDEGLEGSALEIARAEHRLLRVVSGPGTGKTTAMMRRVLRLIERDSVDPRRILLCTFTKTAAADLKRSIERLAAHVSPELSQSVRAVRTTTLHSECLRIIGLNGLIEVTGRSPRTLMEFERDGFLARDLFSPEFGDLRERRTRIQAFGAAWARLQNTKPGWPDNAIDQKFQNHLMSWLRFHHSMLIDELVPFVYSYLSTNPTAPEFASYDYLIIDEYQDLNRAEQEIIQLLSTHSELAVFGDEDQSIYSFKYAHPVGIREFSERNVGTHDEQLEVCRRCPARVVAMANALIANNEDRADRTLRPHDERAGAEGSIDIVQWASLDEEIQGVATYVRLLIGADLTAPGDVLVLTPSREIGYGMRDALRQLGVETHAFFRQQALNPIEAQEAFTLLKLLVNRQDRVSLRCWCGFGVDSRRSNAWARLREYCIEAQLSPWEVLELLAQREIVIAHSGELVTRFIELKSRLDELETLHSDALKYALFPMDAGWAAEIHELLPDVEGYEYSAQDLEEDINKKLIQEELPTEVDYIRIMSLHKSKGLTARVVILAGCIEGLLPIAYHPKFGVDLGLELDEESHLREQRRLFFVGITRTTERLLISSSAYIPYRLASKHTIPIVPTRGRTELCRVLASTFINQLGRSRPRTIPGTILLDSLHGADCSQPED